MFIFIEEAFILRFIYTMISGIYKIIKEDLLLTEFEDKRIIHKIFIMNIISLYVTKRKG